MVIETPPQPSPSLEAEESQLLPGPVGARTTPAVSWLALLRHYPIAGFALAGLIFGFCLFLLRVPGWRFAFAAVAILGGAPLVISTARNMMAGRFFVDTVAALAIISAVLLGEYVAGAMVVLMQAGGEAL